MKKKDDAQQMLAMSAAEAKQRLEEALLQKDRSGQERDWLVWV